MIMILYCFLILNQPKQFVLNLFMQNPKNNEKGTEIVVFFFFKNNRTNHYQERLVKGM